MVGIGLKLNFSGGNTADKNCSFVNYFKVEGGAYLV